MHRTPMDAGVPGGDAAPTVIVTRPQPQADAWVARLQALGQAAVAFPLLAIADCADPGAVALAWRGLSGHALVMFVSPAAVERFFALRPPGLRWPDDTLAGATGPGSAAALVDAGVPPDQVVAPAADAPRFDSEALWALLRARRPWAGARALVVRGEGGRDWLADTLRQHGAAVHFVEAYRRTAPVPDAAARALLAAALAAPGEHVWLLSSSEAIGQLALLAPGADWSGARALATHPRIAQTAAGQGFGRVSTVAPDPQAVVAALRAPAPAEGLDAAAPPGPPTAPRGLQSPRP